MILGKKYTKEELPKENEFPVSALHESPVVCMEKWEDISWFFGVINTLFLTISIFDVIVKLEEYRYSIKGAMLWPEQSFRL